MPIEIPCPGNYIRHYIVNKNNVYMMIIIGLLLFVIIFGGKNDVIENLKSKFGMENKYSGF